MNPLISVVVPVYKVEKYLNRCVSSIIEQSYKNIEIILVDDGSPDNCGKICDEFAAQDARIKVIHKENGGLSDARNFGTKAAKGEFITFVDSDDYVLPDYIEYLYNNLVANDADIACCNFIKSSNENKEIYFPENEKLTSANVISGKEACLKAFTTDMNVYFMVAWCKIFKTELIKKHPFPIGKLREDEATTYKVLYDAKKVVECNKKLYIYFQNDTGIMHGKKIKLRQDMIWALKHRCEYFKHQNDSEMEKVAISHFLNFLIYSEDPKRFDKDFLAFLKKYWFGNKINMRARIKIIIFMISPKLFRKFLNSL